MSLSMIDNVQTATRRERPVARTHSPAPATRRRLRNARRALALVTEPDTAPAPHDHGVRLHPVELGPWDD